MKENIKNVLLIIEDDEIILRALYLAFHEAGCTVATAADGESGLRMTERLRPDLVLLDLLIPKLDGFGYLKAIKSNVELKKTPVIVLSNLGDQDSVDKAKALGAEDYFIKSDTDLSELVKKVSNYWAS